MSVAGNAHGDRPMVFFRRSRLKVIPSWTTLGLIAGLVVFAGIIVTPEAVHAEVTDSANAKALDEVVRLIEYAGLALIFVLVGLGVFLWRARREVYLVIDKWLDTRGKPVEFRDGAVGDARSRADAANKDPLTTYLSLPFGVPEGTVRALLAICILFAAIFVLFAQKVVGNVAATAFGTLLSSVAGFYFGSRVGAADAESANRRALEAETRTAQTEAEARQKTRDAEGLHETVRQEKAALAAQKAEIDATVATAAEAKVAEVTSTIARERTTLETIRQKLSQIQTLAPILRFVLPSGYYESVVAVPLQTADRLLPRVEAILSDGVVDPKAIPSAAADIAAEFGDVIEDVIGDGHPLAVVLGGALRSFGSVTGASVPVAGLAGPAGLLFSLFAGAIAAVKAGSDAYDRWLACILKTPYIMRLSPGSPVDPVIALEALLDAPIFGRAFDPPPSNPVAVALMTLALRHETEETLAKEVFAEPALLPGLPERGQPGAIDTRFTDAAEFAEGLAEYRRALLMWQIRTEDFPNDITLSARRGPNDEPIVFKALDFLDAIGKVQEDRDAAKDVDILGRLVKSLIKTATDTAGLDVVGLVDEMLPAAARIAAKPVAVGTGGRAA